MTGSDDPAASYLFRVTVRLDPDSGYRAEPDTFETVLSRAADPPGEAGWLFFRDTLWRGEIGDAAHGRRLAEDALGMPVESVSFSELRTSDAYLDDLKAAIAEDLDAFNADSVSEVLKKYLGSSIHVR
ncbi:LWR-salt protein [Haloarcula sediminis]|uniref:LWR-salt protein n=1 Tax=Haloarcula sediminis TaxID=3111777 RepID=UPI002D7A032F|nr:LWR-salt protein [Haloarcula sp. CK38]